MNALLYSWGKMLRSIGLQDNKKLLGQANKSTYLIKEAEEVLGKLSWQECIKIEDLQDEITAIKKLIAKQENIAKKLEDIKNGTTKNDTQPQHIYTNKLEMESRQLEQEKRQHYHTIGKFLSSEKNQKIQPYAKILSRQKDLLHKINNLRDTIRRSLALVNE